MGWLSAIGSIFSAIASALGLANKAADAAKAATDQQTGATAQQLDDSKPVIAAAQTSADVASDVDARSSAELHAEAEKWRRE